MDDAEQERKFGLFECSVEVLTRVYSNPIKVEDPSILFLSFLNLISSLTLFVYLFVFRSLVTEFLMEYNYL